jgi:lipoprotein-releasing system ATP-binding protein
MLEAAGIEKSYGALKVLKGVDLTVEQGEVVAIVGASGAGKSTLLHMLGTLDLPDKGRIAIRGKDILSQRPNELARFRNKHIGFVFQFHNLLPEFTALENVMIPAFLFGGNDDEIKARASALLDDLGLAARKDHKPSEMSGGEQQRAAVARALINSPDLILADEPSGNLDSKNAQELHELFFKLRQKMRQTFIIVTHNLGFAGMADRTLEMRDGVIHL